MKKNSELRRYVKELKDLKINQEKRRELISDNTRSELEKKLAKMQIKEARLEALGALIVGSGGTLLTKGGFYLSNKVEGETLSTILFSAALLTGAFSGMITLSSGGYAIRNTYRAARNYLNSLEK